MSLETLLRQVDPLTHRRAEFFRHGVEEVPGLTFSMPGTEGDYLSFSACLANGERWQAIMNMHHWIDLALPGLQALLPEGCSQSDILELFEAAAQPVTAPLECLAYEAITDVHPLRDLSLLGQLLPTMSTPQGALWLSHPPAVDPSPQATAPVWAPALPMPLSWVIGYSQLPCASLGRLARGDVLQISDCRWTVVSCRRVIGEFTPTEEGLFMSISAEQPTITSDQALLEDPAVSGLPVQVEFVLHESTLSLSELKVLIDGGVMPLGENSAREVQVRANGQCVAEGELVRWEDRLGVELHTVHRGEA